MIIALLITNILLLTGVITIAVFYYRKPKQTADEDAEREKKEQQRAINEILNYNVNVARRAKIG